MPQNDSELTTDQMQGPLDGSGSEANGLLWQNLNDFYCNFFDLVGMMAVMVDASGTVRLFNRKAEKLTGYTREDAVGRDWFTLMVPPRERNNMRSRLRICLREDIDDMAHSMPFLTRGGTKRPACWSFSSVRDDDGERCGMIALGQVPPWPDAPCLETARSLDELSGSVGVLTHDLLNHSQVALGYLELALDRTGDNEQLRCMLDRACKAVRRCGDLALSVQKLSSDQGMDSGKKSQIKPL